MAYLPSDLDYGTTLYKPFYSSYDPLITKFKTRPNYYNRPTGSINLFDDIDDLALEVETNNLLTSRYRQINQLNYVPSYFSTNNIFNNENNTSSLTTQNNILKLNDDYNNLNQSEEIPFNNQNKSSQIPKQLPGPSKQQSKNQNLQKSIKPLNKQNFQQNQPNLFQQQQQQQQLFQPDNYNDNYNIISNNNKNFNNIQSPNYLQGYLQPVPFNQQNLNNNQNQIPIQTHNNQQQRLIQYQQRLLQQQQQLQQQNYPNDDNLSELELLKLKQQQDRNQLLATIGSNGIKQNINSNSVYEQNYAPIFQQNHFKQKQYSETSIPSTNADPLNSNNPTPPITSQRNLRNRDLEIFNNNKNFNQKFQNYLQKANDEESGSYLNTLKETRLREQRLAKDKYTTNDYKNYQKNFGFGRNFLPFEETKQEKLERTRKRDEYSKMIKERNHYLNENNNNQRFNLNLNSNDNNYSNQTKRNPIKANELEFPRRNRQQFN